jgi:ribosomal protein S18 acetylase RimI-like enzyme
VPDPHRNLAPLTPFGGVEIVRAATGLDFAQVALVLGEQRAWLEATIDLDVGSLQPSARREYASPAEYYAPPAELLLARLDRRAAGIVGMHPTGDGRVELKRLYVRRSARAAGLGRRLVEEVVARARATGYSAVFLETAPRRMAAAWRLYRSLGFVETRAEGLDGVDDVVGMELPLRDAA